jgi:hypothetical protein
MIVCSIDIGVRNFAFCVEDFHFDGIPKFKPSFTETGVPTEEYQKLLHMLYNCGCLIAYEKSDISGEDIYLNLTLFLNKFRDLWRNVDIFLVEKQMSYGKGKSNVTALRLSQHCLTYFMVLFGPFKTIIEFPSNLKTQLLGCPRTERRKKLDRKKFAIRECEVILSLRKDKFIKVFEETRKKDDLADVVCQLQAFKIKLGMGR